MSLRLLLLIVHFFSFDFSYTSCCWTAEQLLLLFVVATSAAVPAAGSGGGGGGYDCYHSHYLHVSSVLVIVYVLLLILWGLQNKCINENPRKTSEGKQTAQVGRACCWSPLSSDKINLFFVCVCDWTCICVRTFCVCFLFVFHFTFVPFRSWVTNQLFIVCWQKTSAGTLTDSLVCNRHILLIRLM